MHFIRLLFTYVVFSIAFSLLYRRTFYTAPYTKLEWLHRMCVLICATAATAVLTAAPCMYECVRVCVCVCVRCHCTIYTRTVNNTRKSTRSIFCAGDRYSDTANEQKRTAISYFTITAAAAAAAAATNNNGNSTYLCTCSLSRRSYLVAVPPYQPHFIFCVSHIANLYIHLYAYNPYTTQIQYIYIYMYKVLAYTRETKVGRER